MTKFLICATCAAPVPFDSNDPFGQAEAEDFLITYHTPEFHSED